MQRLRKIIAAAIKSGQEDSALIYYDKTLHYIGDNEKKYPDKHSFFEVARGVIYGNIAQVYANSDYKKAEMLYKKSIGINSMPKK